jgi:hypothetical protein
LAGFIWGLIGLIACLNEFPDGEEEFVLACFSVPALILMLPTLYYFFINSTTAEVMPGFIGLYFKRRRLQEEAKIAEILPEEKIFIESSAVAHPAPSNNELESEKRNEIKDEDYKGFSRLPYVILIAVIAFVSSMLPEVFALNENTVWLFIIPLLGIIYAIVFYRLQNIGYKNPALLALLGYIPIVNLYFGYACLAFPKDYAVTKKMDPTGRLLTLLFILFWVFMIISAIPAFQYANQAR